jgi:hypothetical protein
MALLWLRDHDLPRLRRAGRPRRLFGSRTATPLGGHPGTAPAGAANQPPPPAPRDDALADRHRSTP